MKKLFAMLLALIMVFSLAACDGDDNPSDNDVNNNSDTSQTTNQNGGGSIGGGNIGGSDIGAGHRCCQRSARDQSFAGIPDILATDTDSAGGQQFWTPFQYQRWV